MTRADLQAQARAFAADISDLLNGTVTNGIKVSAVVTPPGTTVVGRGVTKTSWTPQTIPLTLNASNPRLWLRVAYVLALDPEGRYLTVSKSDFSLCLDEAGDDVLAHYDYDRSPTNSYPSAHVQVNGSNPGVAELCRRADIPAKELGHLHFPVGGRRFRPTLEDIVEALILEDFVEARTGWNQVVKRHRDSWEQMQLRAAVRRNPGPALDLLREMGII